MCFYLRCRYTQVYLLNLYRIDTATPTPKPPSPNPAPSRVVRVHVVGVRGRARDVIRWHPQLVKALHRGHHGLLGVEKFASGSMRDGALLRKSS